MRNESVEFLLVDDNEDDVVLVQECFAEARISNPLHVVHSGEEALSFLRRENGFADAPTVGLVLLDINMPGMSGFDILGAMKADPALARIPVVMLTTSGRDDDVVRSYEKGAASYVRKPVDFEQFRNVVHHFAMYWSVVAMLPPAKE